MRLVPVVFALSLSGPVLAQASLSIVVELTKPTGPDARLRVALCTDENSFEEGYGCVTASEEAQFPVARITLSDLKPGVYALKCYVDDNANGELDTGWLGIPSEPYGFSNNAFRLGVPPTFDMAKFTITDGANVQRIKLK